MWWWTLWLVVALIDTIVFTKYFQTLGSMIYSTICLSSSPQKFFPQKCYRCLCTRARLVSKVGTDHDDVRRALAVVVTVSCNSHGECFHGKIAHFDFWNLNWAALQEFYVNNQKQIYDKQMFIVYNQYN